MVVNFSAIPTIKELSLMLRTGCKNLTYTQRLILEQLLLSGLHKTAIACSLGVCVSTVYNEIKRGTYFTNNARDTTSSENRITAISAGTAPRSRNKSIAIT